jgi:hypothetical protein
MIIPEGSYQFQIKDIKFCVERIAVKNLTLKYGG